MPRPWRSSRRTRAISSTSRSRPLASMPSARRKASGSRTLPAGATWISTATTSITSAMVIQGSRRRSGGRWTSCPSHPGASLARRRSSSRASWLSWHRVRSQRCSWHPAGRRRSRSRSRSRARPRGGTRRSPSGTPSTAPASPRRASAARSSSARAPSVRSCRGPRMFRPTIATAIPSAPAIPAGHSTTKAAARSSPAWCVTRSRRRATSPP